MATGKNEMLRRYTPLAGMALALVLVMTILPSALHQPQSNPSTTPEFAPVTPGKDDAAQQGGNTSALGLAGSASLANGDAGGAATIDSLPPSANAGGANGKSPRTKRCVGSPPRQTEDPLSPPCVADFRGNNGGATYQGVTANEVVVIAYFNGNTGETTSQGNETGPVNTYNDLGQAAKGNEFVYSRILRIYQAAFNDRYQTYDRAVRIIVHYSGAGPSYTPEERRGDAAEDFSRYHPFAVLNFAGLNNDAYTDAMAQHGVLAFLGRLGTFGALAVESSFFNRFPGLVWSYLPSVEERARLFTTWLCTKALHENASFSGNAGQNGNPRVFGLVGVNDANRADMTSYTKAVKAGFEQCGGHFEQVSYVDKANPQNEGLDMAGFQRAGISTVVWVAGTASEYSNHASNLQYRPEWLIAGDLAADTNLAARLYDPTEWANARAVTTYTRVDSPTSRPCFTTGREAEATTPDQDLNTYGCGFYPYLQQLFTGFQVAGPRLTPSSMDSGFHAIPAVASKDPTVPACFYRQGDYTCVKDAMVTWWDAAGQAPGASAKGCWRMEEDGLRHLAGTWPEGDVDAQRKSTDPCNAQGPDL